MAETGDHRPLQSKRKAIVTFLPYAVWQEREGRHEILDTFLRVARASKERQLTWNRSRKFPTALLSEASPRAIVLVSPHIRWDRYHGKTELVQRWATAASVVPYTEEVGQSVVDVLLQIASVDRRLVLGLPASIWSWLTKRPPLPPICMGYHVGTQRHVVEAVRKLKNVEVLKSYFLLVWSEWNNLRDDRGFDEMRVSIREDFGGIGMAHHRAELIQRLDHVLGQLDQELEHPEKLGAMVSRIRRER